MNNEIKIFNFIMNTVLLVQYLGHWQPTKNVTIIQERNIFKQTKYLGI